MKKIMEWYFRCVVGRHYVSMTLAALALTLVSAAVIATQWNINSDFKELLPRSSEAFQAMEEVGLRVGSGSSLFVVIDSPDGAANREFARVYSEALLELPDVALAHYHNDKSFFEDHRLLYVDVEDLEELHQRIRSRIRREKQKQNPLFVPLRRSSSEGALVDTSQIEDRYEDLAHQSHKEFLESDDGYSLTIVVRFVEGSTNLTATNELLDRVRRLGVELDPTAYHPEMKIEYGGGLVSRQAEYRTIVDDIQSSAVFTIFGLFFVIALYFRRARAVVLVLSPLVMGVAWTLALAFSVYGELTTISVFIFAILLGLGIDFSIHLLSGYDRARREGVEPLEALLRCYTSVGQATVMGAATTFLTFIILSFAQFRGLSQFGQVAALGIALTVAAMVLALPPMVLTFQRIWPHEPRPIDEGARLAAVARWFSGRRQRRIAPLSLGLAAILTIFAVSQLGGLVFEENFRKIAEIEPPWHHEEEGLSQAEALATRGGRSAAAQAIASAIDMRAQVSPETYVADREQTSTGAKYTSALQGQMSSTPTLLLTDSAVAAEEVYRRFEALHAAGELETVRSVGSIYAFLPGSVAEQEERRQELAAIAETLADEDLEDFLSEDQFAEVEEMRPLLEVDAVTVYELPEWTKRLFREAGPQARAPAEEEEFAFEYLVYINEGIDHMNGPEARRFLGELQTTLESVDVDARIGSQSYIYTAMLDEILYDGARMLLIALVLVLLMLILFFRNPLKGMVSVIPLSFGVLWMLGFCAWLGVKLDFFNVIILPLIIGIGVDDGVHFYHRYLDLGRGSLARVSREVGSAITMTTVTSTIGFGGLAVTNYAGLQSIGYLAIAGLLGAYLATLLVLPAGLWWAEKRGWRWVLPR